MTANKHQLRATKSLIIMFIIILSNLLFLSCYYTKAQPVIIEKTDNIKEIAQYDYNYGGYFNDISGEKDLVVVSSYDRVYLFNISNSNNPFIETEIPFYDVDDVILKDDLLYIIQNNQFQIYSLVNNNLLLCDNITFSVFCYKITIHENHAYLTLEGGNISIVDITNPDNLELKANFHVGENIRVLSLCDNYLYVLNFNNDIIVQNVTDKANPTTVLIYNLGTESYYSAMILINGYLYIVNGTSNQLIVYNCSLPTIFDFVASYSNYSGSSMAIQDNLLFILGGNNLQVVDITKVENPVKIADEELLSGSTSEIYIKNTTLFAIEFLGGMTVIDISNSSQPVKITYFGVGGDSQDILALNDQLLVCNGYSSIEILNLNEKDELVKIAHYREENEETYCYSEIHDIDGLLYVTTTTQDLLLLEMQENYSLVKITEYHDPQSSLTEIVSNGRYLFANAGNGIVVLDVINTYNPTRINFYFDGSAIYDLVVEGNRLYTLYSRGEEQGVRIYDISDPMSQELLGDYQLDQQYYNTKITLHENYLVIALKEKILFLDITNPAQPVKISEYDKKDLRVTSLVSKGNYICLGMAGVSVPGGVSIIDVSDVANPTEIAYYYDGGEARSILIEKNRLFIADGFDGVEILETTFNLEPKSNNILLYILLSVGIVGTLGIAVGTIAYRKKKKRRFSESYE